MDLFLQYSDVFLRFANVCIILFGLYKFLGKPHSDLEERVTTIEVKVKEHEECLHQGNDNFGKQKKTNALIITSLIALIEFEVDYCMHHGDEKISPRLDKTKEDLQGYLAEK